MDSTGAASTPRTDRRETLQGLTNHRITLRKTVIEPFRSSNTEASTVEPGLYHHDIDRLKADRKERQQYHVRRSLTLDYEFIKEWLAVCDEQHKCSQPAEGPILLLAIDCVAMNLVEIGSHQKYFALSYVWGNVDAPKLTNALLHRLLLPSALRHLGPLSNTIDDAIRLVRCIGQRYLWVDRMCIIQDNKIHATRAINMMHHIYANAWAVIIAGSGRDSNAGLPRVPLDGQSDAPPLWSREIADISHEDLSTTCYETRAWTYQERALARRRIVFLENFVEFQCPRVSFRDDVHANVSSTLVDARSVSPYDAGMYFENFRNSSVAYRNAVHTYCTREMENPNDILRAFAGVSSFLGTMLGTEVICGLLKNHLLDTLCWKFREQNLPGFGRRHGFPSWSWCGWVAAIDIPFLPSMKGTTRETQSQASVTAKDYRLCIRSIVATFSIGQPLIKDRDNTPMFADFPLLDSDSVICGSIQLPYVRNDLVGTQQQFVILKDSETHTVAQTKLQHITRPWDLYNKNHEYPIAEDFDRTETEVKALTAKFPFFIVLMLDQVKSGGLERAGVGHLYRNALLWSLQFSFEDEIILG